MLFINGSYRQRKPYTQSPSTLPLFLICDTKRVVPAASSKLHGRNISKLDSELYHWEDYEPMRFPNYRRYSLPLLMMDKFELVSEDYD